MVGPKSKNILAEAQAEIERKSVTIATPASDGYAVPALIAKNIERRVTTLNQFSQLVEVVQVGSSDFRKLVKRVRVGEAGTRSETSTSVQAKPTSGDLYAYAKASEEAMQDLFFNVGS